MSEDIIDLVLFLARESTGKTETRDDELINIWKDNKETITLTDVTVLALAAHPVRWGEFQWGLATWG